MLSIVYCKDVLSVVTILLLKKLFNEQNPLNDDQSEQRKVKEEKRKVI